jgi:hypothetical protein
MKTALKILFVPVVLCGLTAFGMAATILAEKHPLPVANIGARFEPGGAFVSSVGKPESN